MGDWYDYTEVLFLPLQHHHCYTADGYCKFQGSLPAEDDEETLSYMAN